ncbi:baseplate assembly protein [Aeromonas phage 59.1]|nr:baseplate assembly protein [Aeromonas phage 59.1]
MAGIDLGLLPPLSAVKQMTHEEIQAEMSKIGSLDQMTPSDPAFRAMLAGSYRETLLRQDADEQCRAVMLASAFGSDLDNIGVTYYRQADGLPVVRLDGENDEDYRYRLHNSPGGLSTAGPKDAYEFHAMSAHPNIKEALCISPAPVKIKMYLLGREGSGIVTAEQCRLVEGYLWTRRPLTDQVEAVPADVVEYSVDAEIFQIKNSDPAGVTAKSKASLDSYVKLQHRLKGKITLSALHAVMMVPGVEEVRVSNWTDVVCPASAAPFCTGASVTFGGWQEADE